MIRAFFILSLLVLLSGCYEAILEVHPDSRLPAWLVLSPGLQRSDIEVKLFLRGEGQVDFRIYAKGELIESERGKRSWHPLSIQRGVNTYPSWSIIAVKGVSEIYEHKTIGHWLYIVDEANAG